MARFCIALLLLLYAAPAMADDPVVTIVVRDHQFIPSDVPVPAGVKVKLLIRNEQKQSAEFESDALHREKIIAAGAQATLFVGPLDPGTYDFFDDFNRATRGRLIVK